MLSALEVKRKLPQKFVETLYENYTPVTVDKILTGMYEKRYTTLRVNTIKYNIEDLIAVLKKENIEFEKVEWYENALIIKNVNERKLQELEIYKNGYIYIQSLSSMIPPLVLNPKRGDKVLDLTAAPGSKTTQMSAMMENEGYILANELDTIRCQRLKYNVDMQGASIVEINNANGEIIGEKYPNTFDKILLDVPCSGEGRFEIEVEKTYKNWSTKQVEELLQVQRKLFNSAIKALKPGGEMVYSTCTLNTKENEEILNWGLKNFKIRIEDIDLKLKNTTKGITKGFDNSLKKAIRVLPNKYQEGFFVAKIIK